MCACVLSETGNTEVTHTQNNLGHIELSLLCLLNNCHTMRWKAEVGGLLEFGVSNQSKTQSKTFTQKLIKNKVQK